MSRASRRSKKKREPRPTRKGVELALYKKRKSNEVKGSLLPVCVGEERPVGCRVYNPPKLPAVRLGSGGECLNPYIGRPSCRAIERGSAFEGDMRAETSSQKESSWPYIKERSQRKEGKEGRFLYIEAFVMKGAKVAIYMCRWWLRKDDVLANIYCCDVKV